MELPRREPLRTHKRLWNYQAGSKATPHAHRHPPHQQAALAPVRPGSPPAPQSGSRTGSQAGGAQPPREKALRAGRIGPQLEPRTPVRPPQAHTALTTGAWGPMSWKRLLSPWKV